MQLNPKLIQYSLQVKYCQSKIIQDQHNQHLKKLDQIQRKSNFSKIKRQAQSLKNISQSMNRYHEISRSFKSKQKQQMRSYQDIKMIKSLSQIHRKKDNIEKVHTEQNQIHIEYKKRKQTHNKIAQILKTKQLEDQNLKIGLRIARQENNFAYVNKIKNQIKEYTKAKKNLIRIKEQPQSNGSRLKKNLQKAKVVKLLTEAEELPLNLDNKPQRKKTQYKIKTKTEAGCEDDHEQFLYEMLKKHPSQILIQRQFDSEVQKQKKQLISLPQIKSRSKNQRQIVNTGNKNT